MLNNLGLGFVLQARDEASHVVHHLHDGLVELKHEAHSAGSSVASALGTAGRMTMVAASAAVAVAGATGAAMFELAEHAEGFSSAIRQAGVASHATAEQMHELEEVAARKGIDSLAGSTIGAAEALAELAKEGFDAHDAGQALSGTLALMKVSMGALSARNAAGLVNDSLGQFQMRADQAMELADSLAVAMQRFGFRAEELQGTLSGLAAGAQLTGASLQDTLIGVGLVKQVFPSATKAAAAMNAAMQQLASSRAQKELGLIGVRVVDTTGKIRPLVEIMGSLAERTAGMTDAMIAHKLESIAGGRAAGGLSAIIDGLRKGVKDASGQTLTGAAAIGYLREQLAGAGGTASKMASILGDDMGGAIKALKNAISNLGVVMGEGFEGGFKRAVQGLNLFVRGITQLFSQGGFTGEVKDALDQHLGIKGFAIGVFMWIERLRTLFGSLRQSFTQAFAQFRPALGELLTAFRQLGQALGIVDQTAGDNASTWESFATVGAAVGRWLAEVAGLWIPILIHDLQGLTVVVEFMKDAWASLKPVLAPIGQMLIGIFEVVGGILTGNWKKAWDGLIDIVAGALRVVLKITMGALGVIADAFDSLGSTFGLDSGLRNKLDAFHRQAEAGIVIGANYAKSTVSDSASLSPAVAHTQRLASAVQAGSLGAAASAGAAGTQIIHVHVPLHIDGEKIAEANATAKRDSNARSFQPVAAHGGGF